uniref:Uncharacterized protein n=1 Tax=Mesocestoides corti TaxID=53468 RepID=A0A5K3FKY2_MESCO
MCRTWPRVFLVEAIEAFIGGVEGSKFVKFLGVIYAMEASANQGSAEATERIGTIVRNITDLRPSPEEFSLLKTLSLFRTGESPATTRGHDHLQRLCNLIHHNLSAHIRTNSFANRERTKALLQCSAAIESVPEVASFLLQGVFQRIFNCSRENLSRMIERMTLAAIEAVNQAALQQS